MKPVIIIVQALILILISLLISGIIRKIKDNLKMRKGASIFQPYYNFLKLLSKDEVISENSSWIFKITPFIVLAAAITATCLIPLFGTGFSLNNMGDIFTLIFILALGRFCLSLAGLDTASTFSGMGSSREMFISSLVEPVALLALFVVALNSGSTNLSLIAGVFNFKLSSLVAVIALFMVTISETSRIPIDNHETHLELTMIHEAMLLEYSGRSLAMLELATHIKQMIFFSLIAIILFPLIILPSFGLYQILFTIAFFLLKILIIGTLIALVEISIAKMRLFRVVDFLGFAFVLSLTALIIQTWGM